MILKASLIFILISAFFTTLPASDFVFQTLSMSEGLSSNDVTAIIQDQTGYLWVATKNGLNLFDGYEFTHYFYDADDSSLVADNVINDIVEDADSSLWIATGRGLTHLNKYADSATHYFAGDDEATTLSNDYVLSLCMDKSNTLWIGSAWGMNVYDPQTHTFSRLIFGAPGKNSNDRNRIWDIEQSLDGTIWAGTDDGLVLIDPLTRQLVTDITRLGFPDALAHAQIRAIKFDSLGSAWIGTAEGVYYIDSKTRHFKTIESAGNADEKNVLKHILSIEIGPQNNVWIGTQNGLYIFDPRTQNTIKVTSNAGSAHSMPSQFIEVLYKDRFGVMWIGTQEGLTKFSLYWQSFHSKIVSMDQEYGSSNILSLAPCLDNSLLLSTPSGIYRWRKDHQSFVKMDEIFPSASCKAGNVVRDFIWVADTLYFVVNGNDYGGLYRYSAKTKSTSPLLSKELDELEAAAKMISCIEPDADGNLWLGTEGAGILIYDPRKDTMRRMRSDYLNTDSLSGNWIFTIVRADNGSMWIGTENGVTIYNSAQKSNTMYRHSDADPNSLASHEIQTIYRDSRGEFWLGGEAGLSRWLGNGLFANYELKTENGKLQVNAIVEDKDGYLWLSTPINIIRFDPKSENMIIFNDEHGIFTHDFYIGSSLVLDDGTIIFGGHNGFCWFDPEKVLVNQNIPPAAITKISDYTKPLFAGKKIAFLPELTFAYNENFLEFEFSALDYHSLENYTYYFKLDGYDRGWRKTSQTRSATYAKLPPGQYIFKVCTGTEQDRWDSSQTQLKITIVPPFWQTNWFQMLSFLSFISLFIGIVYVLHKRAEARQIKLERLVAERTRELQEKNVQLAQAKADYQNLYDNAPAGYQELDADGRITQVNRTACDILGFSREELIGRRVFDFIAEHERGEAVENFTLLIAGEKQHGTIERTYIRKDGRPIVLAIKFKVLYDKQTGKEVIRNSFQDVSEIRELEEQLRQSQRLEAIGRLAGGIAHDFNNILTIIRGYCSILMRKTKDQPPVANTLAKIDEASARAEKLTRQLLAFSRRQQLQPQVINLNNQLEQIEEMLARLIGEKVTIKMTLADDLHNVMVDPDQFEHLIINMAANARDAMPDGGLLTFRTQNTHFDRKQKMHGGILHAGDYVRLTISDSGSGIPDTVLDHIFEPFFSKKEKGKGTGLGLAMAYGFVTQSSGQIDVQSKVGKGTSFDIYFPTTDEALPVSKAAVDVDMDLSGTETILVVEDEDHVRTLIGTALQEHGYTVHLSSEREDELRDILTKNTHFDLILSDVIMPTQNGPQVVKFVQSCFPHIKVLYMSGYSDDHISSHGVLNEGVYFLQKPFTPQRLLNKIRSVLDTAQIASS